MSSHLDIFSYNSSLPIKNSFSTKTQISYFLTLGYISLTLIIFILLYQGLVLKTFGHTYSHIETSMSGRNLNLDQNSLFLYFSHNNSILDDSELKMNDIYFDLHYYDEDEVTTLKYSPCFYYNKDFVTNVTGFCINDSVLLEKEFNSEKAFVTVEVNLCNKDTIYREFCLFKFQLDDFFVHLDHLSYDILTNTFQKTQIIREKLSMSKADKSFLLDSLVTIKEKSFLSFSNKFQDTLLPQISRLIAQNTTTIKQQTLHRLETKDNHKPPSHLPTKHDDSPPNRSTIPDYENLPHINLNKIMLSSQGLNYTSHFDKGTYQNDNYFVSKQIDAHHSLKNFGNNLNPHTYLRLNLKYSGKLTEIYHIKQSNYLFLLSVFVALSLIIYMIFSYVGTWINKKQYEISLMNDLFDISKKPLPSSNESKKKRFFIRDNIGDSDNDIEINYLNNNSKKNLGISNNNSNAISNNLYRTNLSRSNFANNQSMINANNLLPGINGNNFTNCLRASHFSKLNNNKKRFSIKKLIDNDLNLITENTESESENCYNTPLPVLRSNISKRRVSENLDNYNIVNNINSINTINSINEINRISSNVNIDNINTAKTVNMNNNSNSNYEYNTNYNKNYMNSSNIYDNNINSNDSNINKNYPINIWESIDDLINSTNNKNIENTNNSNNVTPNSQNIAQLENDFENNFNKNFNDSEEELEFNQKVSEIEEVNRRASNFSDLANLPKNSIESRVSQTYQRSKENNDVIIKEDKYSGLNNNSNKDIAISQSFNSPFSFIRNNDNNMNNNEKKNTYTNNNENNDVIKINSLSKDYAILVNKVNNITNTPTNQSKTDDIKTDTKLLNTNSIDNSNTRSFNPNNNLKQSILPSILKSKSKTKTSSKKIIIKNNDTNNNSLKPLSNNHLYPNISERLNNSNTSVEINNKSHNILENSNRSFYKKYKFHSFINRNNKNNCHSKKINNSEIKTTSDLRYFNPALPKSYSDDAWYTSNNYFSNISSNNNFNSNMNNSYNSNGSIKIIEEKEPMHSFVKVSNHNFNENKAFEIDSSDIDEKDKNSDNWKNNGNICDCSKKHLDISKDSITHNKDINNNEVLESEANLISNNKNLISEDRYKNNIYLNGGISNFNSNSCLNIHVNLDNINNNKNNNDSINFNESQTNKNISKSFLSKFSDIVGQIKTNYFKMLLGNNDNSPSNNSMEENFNNEFDYRNLSNEEKDKELSKTEVVSNVDKDNKDINEASYSNSIQEPKKKFENKPIILNKKLLRTDDDNEDDDLDKEITILDKPKTKYTYCCKHGCLVPITDIKSNITNNDLYNDRGISYNGNSNNKEITNIELKSVKDNINTKSGANNIKCNNTNIITDTYIAYNSKNKTNLLTINKPTRKIQTLNEIISSPITTKNNNNYSSIKNTHLDLNSATSITNSSPNNHNPSNKASQSSIKEVSPGELFFTCCRKSSTKQQAKEYLHALRLFREQIDVSNLYRLKNEIEIIKYLLFDFDQLNLFNTLRSKKRTLNINEKEGQKQKKLVELPENIVVENEITTPYLISSLRKLENIDVYWKEKSHIYGNNNINNNNTNSSIYGSYSKNFKNNLFKKSSSGFSESTTENESCSYYNDTYLGISNKNSKHSNISNNRFLSAYNKNENNINYPYFNQYNNEYSQINFNPFISGVSNSSNNNNNNINNSMINMNNMNSSSNNDVNCVNIESHVVNQINQKLVKMYKKASKDQILIN